MSEKRAVPVCLVSLAVMGGPAGAQTLDEHLRAGFALRQRGAEVEALARFEAAWALSATPRVAAQLGLAHQALGRWLEADRFLRLALAAADDPWVVRNRASLTVALGVVCRRDGCEGARASRSRPR
jgi:tetratricopeptide (TPR) repeat protein